ncbi:MAG: acetate--CoA ligase family protein [Smithellaceae bacterium]
MKGLAAIFSPQSIAVVGASTTPGKVGYDIFANILKGGYRGTLYPVNPSAHSISSVKAFVSITDIPDTIDLAIIILPPKLALPAVEEAIKKKVGGVVIVSAGFREVGAEGRRIEDKIVAVCQEAGVRLIGPNCLGVINPIESVRMNASFATHMPQSGNISFISQSGALCTSVLDFAASRDFGFSKFISIGNKADVDELDILRYLHLDLDTEVIMIYLEELRRGPEFIEEVKRITSGDRPIPILAIKSGRTSAGAAAAASHTGSLAGSEAVYDAIFKQSGIIRCDTIDQLFDYANVFTYKTRGELGKRRRKLPKGNRVAIVTNAGGPGILATDMTMSSGLQLAKFSDETRAILSSALPSAASIRNPVDVIGDAQYDRYEKALTAVIDDENVDGALVILTPQSMTNALETAQVVVKIAHSSRKPVICCFMGIGDVSDGVRYFQENGYPVYRFPENAARAFSVLYQYSSWLTRETLEPFQLSHDKEKASLIIKKCIEEGKTRLGELDGNELLQCYGIPVLPTALAKTPQEASDIAFKIGFPVVMKIVSPQILHKSDAGGVMVGLKTREEVTAAFERIVTNAGNFNSDAEINGVLIVKMASPGEEVILGATRYPIFGPLLMFGLGGIFVEVFKDVEFRLAPLDRNDTHQMIQSIKGYKLLKGFRGRPKADTQILEKILMSLSEMVMNHPDIKEMDINPMLVHEEGKGATAVDCRIILETISG